MSIMDILKKLNIVRAGKVAAVYTNAKDRPMALQDDMFLGKDEPPKSGTPVTPPSGGRQKPGKALLLASLILAVVSILFAFTTTIAWLFILFWVVWCIYIWFVYIGKILWFFGFSITIYLIIFLIISSFGILLTQNSVKKNTSSSNTSTAKLTSAECQPYYDKYNGKVMNISGDGLKGTVAIKIDKSNGCKLLGWYNVLLSYNLPQNPYKRDVGPAYHYIVTLRTANQTTRSENDGYGALSPAFKNQTVLPDPYSTSSQRAALYSQGINATETRYFYWGYNIETNFSEKRYQEIFQKTKLEIVDGMKFIEEKTEGSTFSYSINQDRAAESGTISKSFNLTIR
jgi:hypothetical protein